MSLVKCKECGEKISSSAKLCPHCGKKRNQMGCGSWIIVIFFGLVIFSMVSNKSTKTNNIQPESASQTRQQVQNYSPAPKSIEPKEEASKTEVLTITADQLMSHCAMEYDAAMSAGADAEYYKNKIRYMNKTIAIKGTVFHVLSDSSNNPIPYIALKAGFPWAPDGNTVQCFPQENEKESFKNIQAGQLVTIVGIFDNYGRVRQFAEQENAGKSNFKGSGYFARIKECKLANSLTAPPSRAADCSEVQANNDLSLQTSAPRNSVEAGTIQKLGIRNKYAKMSDSYSVLCSVSTSSGSKYNAEGCTIGDHFFYLLYPKDFHGAPPLESGEYLITWTIGKRKVVKDKFIVK